MKINIAICDDDITIIELIESFISSFHIKNDYNFDVSVSKYNSAEALLNDYTVPESFDILFLDVEMPRMNGLALAQRIRNLPDNQVKIIFVSNYPEYMQESFDVQAFNYLKKPLSYERFSDVFSKVYKDIFEKNISKIEVNYDDNTEIINISDILYIESVKNKRDYVTIVTDTKTYESRGSMTEAEAKLPAEVFVSPHRCYLVNINHIRLINKTNVVLDNNISLPLSRRREKLVRDMISKHMLSLYQKQY